MTDRDRLAADLHAPCEERWAERERQMPGFDQTLHMIDAHYAEADRLIALGWTRLDEERLAAQMQRRYGWSPTKAWQEAQIIAKAYREDTDA